MLKRLLTSAIGLIVFFCILPAHLYIFYAAVLVITMIAGFEISKAASNNKILQIIGVLTAIGAFFGTVSGFLNYVIIGIFSFYVVLSVVMFDREKVWNVYLVGFVNTAYAIFLSTLVLLKKDFSAYAVLLPFLFAWITDSGAYFAGRFFGKHKLAKKLSPKKTIEGAIGGVISCVIFALIYQEIVKTGFNLLFFNENQYVMMIIMSVVASVVSQLGDLASSAIKRDYGVKDFGNILPGHGGVLDRFDSVVFTAPFVYFILNIM